MIVTTPIATVVPQLLTQRMASMRTKLPFQLLRDEIERRGGRVVRIAGRWRVYATDVAALIAESQQPTAAEASTRVDAVLAQVLEERGLTKRQRRRRGA